MEQCNEVKTTINALKKALNSGSLACRSKFGTLAIGDFKIQIGNHANIVVKVAVEYL